MKDGKMADKKTCYIIGPIGEPNSKERDWADFVRESVIKPAVTSCGYVDPARADDPHKDLIMMDIIQQMFEADLVVADLTDWNPNVFYELGIRHCAQRPAIHLIKTGQSSPFDLGGNKAIFVDESYKRVTQAVEDIKKRIGAIEENPEQFLSQVQVYMTLKQFDVFKKVGNTKDELTFKVLTTLIQSASLQSNILNKLYDELVEKPKQLSGRYPQTYADAAKLAAGLGEEQNKKLYRKIKR